MNFDNVIGYNFPNEREWASAALTASPVASSDWTARMRAKSIPHLTPAQIEKFWSLVEVHHPSNCWIWCGTKDAYGYGNFPVIVDGTRRTLKSHRVAYHLLIGPFADDAHHLCKNKPCVNPDHIQTITNVEHARITGRRPKPSLHKTHCPHGHELTPENTIVFFNPSKTGGCICRRCRTCREEVNRKSYLKCKGRL